jgi:hypothetical protein
VSQLPPESGGVLRSLGGLPFLLLLAQCTVAEHPPQAPPFPQTPESAEPLTLTPEEQLELFNAS